MSRLAPHEVVQRRPAPHEVAAKHQPAPHKVVPHRPSPTEEEERRKKTALLTTVNLTSVIAMWVSVSPTFAGWWTMQVAPHELVQQALQQQKSLREVIEVLQQALQQCRTMEELNQLFPAIQEVQKVKAPPHERVQINQVIAAYEEKRQRVKEEEERRLKDRLWSLLRKFFRTGYGVWLLVTVQKLMQELGRCPTIRECQKAMFKEAESYSLRKWCVRHEEALRPFLRLHRRRGRNGSYLVPTNFGLLLSLWLQYRLPADRRHLLYGYGGGAHIFQLFRDELINFFLPWLK